MTVHTKRVMTLPYIVYHLDMTRDTFSVNGPLDMTRDAS
jgi:hypothetical protein